MSLQNFTYKVVTEDMPAFSGSGLLFCARERICGGFDCKLEDSDIVAKRSERTHATEIGCGGPPRGRQKECNWKKRLENERRRAGCRDTCKPMKAEKRAPRKPSEFQERLWHEPPEMDYSSYKIYDKVQ